ncbi:MAG: ABC transporter substrate-binding protein [Candidatus Dormibacteraceae bacterium]
MNRRLFKGLLGAAALAVVVSSCQSTNNTSNATGGKPLIAEPTTGVTFSQDFNPYDGNSVASSMGTRTMVNEPLIEFDQLDATAAGTHPWLATAYAFQNAGKDLQVTIRQNVKFNDGSSFGPADVAATFKAMENPKADTTGVPPQASDPTVSGNTVTLHFSAAEYTGLFPILGNTYILKASVADQIAQNPTMTIANPVGTGPFMLKSYSSSLIKWKPNPNYWGGTPPESEIDTPSIATNAAASDALVSGQLDWAGNDIPNVYANYVNLNPLTNHAWFAAGSTVTLWFNLNPGNGGATGINDAAVRKAVSYGVDRNALALLGESGYEQPASSSSGLILPNQSAFLPSDGSLKGDLSLSGNVPDAATAKADSLPAGMDVYDILKNGGWTPPATSRYDSTAGTFKSGGNCDGSNTANCWTKGGQIIKFSVYDPVPFSDYWENAALMSQELQPLGMDVTTKPAQGYSDWNTNITSNPSQWQTAIHWGSGGSIPYTQYQNWFDSKDANSVAHYIGYSNPSADAALRKYESTDPSDTASLYPIVQQLEKIMSTDVPEAPLLYGADWNVFSSAKYTGWPNQSHPYMNPSPSDPQMPYILMQLKPTS